MDASTFNNVVGNAEPIFEHIRTIIHNSGDTCEGNCFFYHETTTRAPELVNKQMNLFQCGINAKNILEIGMNAGHSALFFLLASPTSKLTIFDINYWRYTEPCYKYLDAVFPERITFIPGDSAITVSEYARQNEGIVFDVIHVDGAHDEAHVRSDIENTRKMCTTDTTYIIDDSHHVEIAEIINEYLKRDQLKFMSGFRETYLYEHAIVKWKDVRSAPRKILLVTIAIGDKYLEEYNRLFRKSHEAYASRHNYDFRVVTEWLDPLTRDPNCLSFQKALVGCQTWSTSYETIIFLDADIFINEAAPEIPVSSLKDKIGCVNEWLQPLDRENFQRENGYETSTFDYYRMASPDFLVPYSGVMLNTGVLVFNPSLHGKILSDIYHTHIEKAPGNPRGFHYEQAAIGYELIKSNLYTILDNAWNALWAVWKSEYGDDLRAFVNKHHFTHFAGHVDFDRVQSLYV